jgi:hypothetical protein
MTRRRILVSAAVALLAAGTAGAGAATADTAQGVRVANGDYILCAGVQTVNVATCVESPTGIIVDLLRGNP